MRKKSSVAEWFSPTCSPLTQGTEVIIGCYPSLCDPSSMLRKDDTETSNKHTMLHRYPAQLRNYALTETFTMFMLPIIQITFWDEG